MLSLLSERSQRSHRSQSLGLHGDSGTDLALEEEGDGLDAAGDDTGDDATADDAASSNTSSDGSVEIEELSVEVDRLLQSIGL